MQLEQIDAPTVSATKKDIRKVIRAGIDNFQFGYSYANSRLKGAIDCLRRNARISTQWDYAERAGLVRLCAAPDDTGQTLEDLAGDMYSDECAVGLDGGMRALVAQRKRFERMVQRDGVFGLIGQYRLAPPDDKEWIDADSCWGFIGTFKDSGAADYAWDIMEQTLDALRDALRDRCPNCRQTRKGAMIVDRYWVGYKLDIVKLERI